MASALGGDDIMVASHPSFFGGGPWLQATSDGRLFAAWVNESFAPMDVYRSLDGGDTWTHWSTFTPGGAPIFGDFMIAEGDADRAFIAYAWHNGTSRVAEVAYADLNTDTPVWTPVVALANPALTAAGAHFATDAWAYSDYYVYVAIVAEDGNGQDVWFTRSLDMGNSIGPAVKIGDVSDTSPGFLQAHVSAGASGVIHATMTLFGFGQPGTIYRRAINFAGAGWDPPVTVDPVDNGNTSSNCAPAASRVDGNVAVLFYAGGLGKLRYSSDYGVTWPPANQVDSNVGAAFGAPMAFAGGEFVIGGYGFVGVGDQRYDLARSTTTSPADQAPPQEISAATVTTFETHSAIAPDPSRSDQIAAVWISRDATNDYLRFDAEWRRDPGYANTDIGFPIAVTGGGQTPPAVAEVDGDPELEIVFATLDGNIHVINHDGTEVPGWPVNIGFVPFDGAVAVGDLVGNGIPYIVAGNSAGQVFAFDPNGVVQPGWPVYMPEAADVFVSIGALGPPNPRYVVACGGHEMFVFRHDGTIARFYLFVDPMTEPAAIGDIDNDGVTDIVTLKSSWYHSQILSQQPHLYDRNIVTDTFSDAPTLADVDGNGTLEIAAPTVDGKLYLLNYDGTDFPGWPITVSPGIPLTSAAFGQILGTSEAELVFGQFDGAVHVRYFTGVEQSGYPLASGSLALFMPPMLAPVNISGSNVNIGTTDAVNGTAQSWRNIPAIPVNGWPRNLPGPVEETFASGDIDNDGRNEIVVLGVNFLSVYDVGQAPSGTARNHWPMWGYNAQRTNCLACEDILTAVDDTPKAAYATGLEVHPNPFNPVTTIEYEVETDGRISLDVFDVAGHRVATLVDNEHRKTGRYSVTYNAAGASGVYFARLRTAAGDVTRKMVVLK
jgi:hypothetical protein